jgi:hypothetical protein
MGSGELLTIPRLSEREKDVVSDAGTSWQSGSPRVAAAVAIHAGHDAQIYEMER